RLRDLHQDVEGLILAAASAPAVASAAGWHPDRPTSAPVYGNDLRWIERHLDANDAVAQHQGGERKARMCDIEHELRRIRCPQAEIALRICGQFECDPLVRRPASLHFLFLVAHLSSVK